MSRKEVEKERFQFQYANHVVDCIFSASSEHYELIIAVHDVNYGFVVEIYQNANGMFIAEIDDEIYNGFCNALGLSYSVDHFTSNALLVLLSNHIPTISAGVGVLYQELRQFVQYRHVEEANKIYFCGWNDHVKDGRKAHNFDKTEFYFGKTVADYCRRYNISSLWTDIRRDEKAVTRPWE